MAPCRHPQALGTVTAASYDASNVNVRCEQSDWSGNSIVSLAARERSYIGHCTCLELLCYFGLGPAQLHPAHSVPYELHAAQYERFSPIFVSCSMCMCGILDTLIQQHLRSRAMPTSF